MITRTGRKNEMGKKLGGKRGRSKDRIKRYKEEEESVPQSSTSLSSSFASTVNERVQRLNNSKLEIKETPCFHVC